MLELVNDGDRRAIVAGRLRLAFDWTGDRWVHSLEVQKRDSTASRVIARSVEGDSSGPLGPRLPDVSLLVIVRSVEGDPDRDEPSRVVSPAYQQLEFQGDGLRLQALLVGQSGPHHFSAVFTVEERTPGPSPEILIKVDVADRCRGPVDALAATYTVAAPADDLLQAASTIANWIMGPDRLSFVATEPARVCLAEAGRRATHVQALADLAGPATATRRFLYLWLWEDSVGS